MGQHVAPNQSLSDTTLAAAVQQKGYGMRKIPHSRQVRFTWFCYDNRTQSLRLIASAPQAVAKCYQFGVGLRNEQQAVLDELLCY